MWDRAEDRLKIVLSREELSGLLLASAKVHFGKAKMFRDRAGKLDGVAEVDIPEDPDVDIPVSYGTKVNQGLATAKENLLAQARTHEEQGKRKEFLAGHLSPGPHTLDADEVQKWGLVG